MAQKGIGALLLEVLNRMEEKRQTGSSVSEQYANQVIATPRVQGGTANHGGTGGRLDGSVRAVARENKKTANKKTAVKKKPLTMAQARAMLEKMLREAE